MCHQSRRESQECASTRIHQELPRPPPTCHMQYGVISLKRTPSHFKTLIHPSLVSFRTRAAAVFPPGSCPVRPQRPAAAAAARRGLNRSNLGASKHLGLQRIDAIDTDKALSWKTHHSVLRYEQYGSTRGRGCV